MFTVYVIRNVKGKRYTGHSENKDQRLLRHNGILPSKSTSYTRKVGGKWNIIYYEEYTTRQEAMKREKYLKSSRGRMWLKEKLGR